MELIEKAQPVYKKVHIATRKKELPKTQPRFVIDQALEKGILSKEEAEILRKAEDARVDAVQVDEFTLEEYQNQTPYRPKKKESVKHEEMPK
jgi:acyl-CoA dehydrogenase